MKFSDRFSANLGFLWTELPLNEAIVQAKEYGFSSIELHWPYDTDPLDLKTWLKQADMPLLGINTSRGDVNAGFFGLSALPSYQKEARQSIDQAIDYARISGAKAVHVMAGKTSGPEAASVFADNLRYASQQAPELTFLLEPLNEFDVPGYFLLSNAKAAEIIGKAGADNIRIMFDCYHVARSGYSIKQEFDRWKDMIGHIQFASVPSRNEPDQGQVDYFELLPYFCEHGYQGYLGAEYKPLSKTEDGLGWLQKMQQTEI